jgi:intracellular sulfur oxidation DsrE/DsrF family protein
MQYNFGVTRPLIAAVAIFAVMLAGLAFSGPSVHAGEAMHKIAVHVDSSDPKTINLALNNVQNVKKYYESKGETIRIEVVAYGPGLTMFLADKSPVKDRVAAMALEDPDLQFSACSNTHAKMSKKAGKQLALLPEAKMVPSGVVRLVELQEQGYSYIRP